jgi:outer membrane protein TolC
MKKFFIFLLLTVCSNAGDLKSLLEYAVKHNALSVSNDIKTRRPLIEKKSIKKASFPKLYVGVAYQRYNPMLTGVPGDIYNGYVKLSFNLFDGNKKKNQIESKNYEYKSLNFQSKSYKKQLEYNIVNVYFNIKTLRANLAALQKAKEYLQAENSRVKNLFDAGAVTEDEVKKIEASLFNTVYQIENVKYQIAQLKKNLNLYVGKDVENIGNSIILPPSPGKLKADLLDYIKSLQAQVKQTEYNAKSLDSVYYPQINIEDTYNRYRYARTDTYHPEGEKFDNKLTLSVNLLIFDNSSVKTQKEAVLINKITLNRQIDYYKKEQQKNIQLALLKIKTVKSQIESARKSLESANKAFEIISNRYHSGEITAVDYLDALSVKTNAQAQYKAALYSLQTAYAAYYLYTNYEIKEYVK